eukprot:s336_g3.t1
MRVPERGQAVAMRETLVADGDKHRGRMAEDSSMRAVEQLIAEAQEAALVQGSSLGGSPGDSQEFHRTVREQLIRVASRPLQGTTLAAFGPMLCEAMKIIGHDELCRPQSTAKRVGLFPIPLPGLTEFSTEREAFLHATIRALNHMNGVASRAETRGSLSSLQAEKRLRAVIQGSAALDEAIPTLDFPSLFSSKGVSYMGEEIQLARPLKWKSIAAGLPAEVGLQQVGKPPKVMVHPSDWFEMAQGLVQKGICEVVRASELYQVQHTPVLNGMFAIGKGEFQGNLETCRLIMNLKPVNQLCYQLVGDTATLPTATCLGQMTLDPEEQLVTSSEDIRCFFYLFQVPRPWIRFLGFGLAVPRELVPNEFGDEVGYLAAKVLPMGFVNSVSIAQHIHRLVVRRCLATLRPPLGGESELRRDRLFSSCPTLFRVYLDNFDQLQRVHKNLAQVIQGNTSPIVEHLREAYINTGLPRHPKKSVEQQLCAEVQGAWVDGEKGEVSAKPAKIAKYFTLAWEVIKAGRASQRELQVIGGGLVYLSMFRRPLLGGLNQIWRQIVALGDRGTSLRVSLPLPVLEELVRFLCLVPLAYMDLRLEVCAAVSASDASTTGGGVCVSRGLTPYGLAAQGALVRGHLPEEHDFTQILSVGLFDGISGLRVALDSLGVPVAGHVSIEQSPEARRVVESFFPDTIFVEDVVGVDLAMVKQWALRYPNVGLVLVGAGPPCQGVSGLNADRRGALKDYRSCLFQHVPQIVELCKLAFPWAQVHDLVENVASMDYQDCETMSSAFGKWPWFIEASGISLAHRPRLYWVSWELVAGPGARILPGTDGRLPLEGEVQLQADILPEDFLTPGCHLWPGKKLPTFTTARPSSAPMRRPAGLKDCQNHERERWQQHDHRFPPYQYKDVNCVHSNTDAPRPPNVAEREAILGFPLGYTKQCMPKSEHDKPHHKDCRLSLLGNSWSVPVVAWILSCLLSILGFMEVLTVQDIVDRLTSGKATNLQSLLLRPPMRGQRYQESLQHFFKYLENAQLQLPTQRDRMDPLVSDYLEYIWAEGEGRSLASNVLAGLQDFDPKLKGCLPGSWRLMKTWATNEVPCRAPPLTEPVLRAMVGWAVFHQEFNFGLSLLVGFHGLLRSGELLALQNWQIHMASPGKPAVLNLGLTKSGKRQGAAESVTLTDKQEYRDFVEKGSNQ